MTLTIPPALRRFLRPLAWALLALALALTSLRFAVGGFGGNHDSLTDFSLLVISGILIAVVSRRPLRHGLAHRAAWTEAVFGSLDAAVVTIGPSGRIEEFSREAEHLFGISAGEAIGTPWVRLYPQEATAGSGRTVLRHHSGRHFLAEVRIGEYRYDGTIYRTLAITDIDALAAQEAELAQWRQIFAQARWASAIVGIGSTTLERINPHFLRLFDYQENELVGVPIYQLLASRERDFLAQQLTLANDEGGATFESICLRRNGCEFAARIDIGIIRDEDGRPCLRIVSIRDIGLRKMLEQNLHDSEQMLHLLTESQRDLLTRWRPDSTLEFVNGAFAELYHCPPSKLIGQRWIDLLPVSIRDTMRERVAALAARPERQEQEHALQGSDGRQRWFNWVNVPLFEADGSLRGYQGIGHDVTARHLAEQALAAREGEIRALFAGNHQVLLLLDASGHIRRANRGALVLLGETANSGRRLIDVRAFAATADVLGPALERASEGMASHFEIATHIDDCKRFLRCSLLPVRDEPAEHVCTLLFEAFDVTEWHSTAQSAADQDARLRGIASSIPGFVFEFVIEDGNPRATYASDGIAGLLNVGAEAVTAGDGRIVDHIHPDDRQKFLGSISQCALDGREWTWTGRVAASYGREPRWIAMHAVPRLVGRRYRWDGVALDISDRKEKEEEIAASQQTLRELSAHRETVREEERTYIAREIHDELGQYLSALRMGLSVLAVQEKDNRKLHEPLRQLKATVDQSIRQVRNITTSLRPTALDMGLAAALRWLTGEFQNHHGILCSLDTEGLSLELDDLMATGLFRIVQESLTNISRHAQAQHVAILIRHIGAFLVLEIRDDGRGFIPNASGQRKGFGLLGMHERALMLNGTVQIHSTPGSGTIISVSVPVAR
jgi:PAS domain S-box-containing protein